MKQASALASITTTTGWQFIQRILLLIFAMASPVLDALGQQSIPLFSSSSGQLLGWAIGVSALLGAIICLVGLQIPSTWRPAFWAGYLVLTVLVFAELSGAGAWLATQVEQLTGAGIVKSVVMLFFVAVAGSILARLFFFVGPPATTVATMFFAFIFLSSIGKHWIEWAPSSETTKITTASDKPPIIHIVLDELIGIAGIPKAFAGGVELERQMLEVFSRLGFRIYPRAYSRHFMTAMSVPNLLNYDFEDATYGTVSKYQNRDNFRVNDRNRHFEELRKRGYALAVYQTVFFNFCKSVQVEQCQMFPSYNPWNHYLKVGPVVSDARRKTAQILQRASTSSRLLRWFFGVFIGDARSLDNLLNPIRFDLHGIEAWIDQVGRGILANPRGVAHFVHVLAPHGPYILDRNCVISRPWGPLPQFMREDRGLSADAFVIERKAQYEMYFEQSRCVLTLIDQLLTKVVANPQFEDATVVVHGDHGSRLSAGRFLESLSSIDKIDNYSTFYAIRAPNIQAGIDARSVSVQRLFAEQMGPADISQTSDPGTIVIERREPPTAESFPPP